ncbi:MAG: hypothetical protein CMP10_03730 [Zetaproteobacteria bacterium]|nr:hypothetical protein [Pseudobdellovibrionaceae bacterium]|tara:strand:- start:813 stop:1532 length:720 start_codon:yes stop_codon:yes gene_type:complete
MKHIFRFRGVYNNNEWTICESEFRHIKKIIKLGDGQRIEIFDGQGSWASGLYRTENGCPSLEVIEHTSCKSTGRNLGIAVGALKPGFIDDVVPCLVELGVTSINVIAQEGVAKSRMSEKAIGRWDRIMWESMKQSKRLWVPEISCYSSMDEFCAEWGQQIGWDKFYSEPGEKVSLQASPIKSSGVIAVVGAELGLSDRDIQNLSNSGFEGFSLGKGVLRSFTACIAVSSILASRILWAE